MNLDIGKYKIESLDFAYNENNEVVTIKAAVKNTPYFLYEDKETELIVAEGTINVKHFRTKSSSDNHINESPEHFRAKRKIVEDGYFIYRDAKIVPFRVVCEKQIFKGKRPDITFYNEDNSILCVIEVFKTCRKTEEDIKQFTKENITVYEYNINIGATKCISCSSEVRATIKRERKIQVKLEHDRQIVILNREIEEIERRVERTKLEILEQESKSRKPNIKQEIGELEREFTFETKEEIEEVEGLKRQINIQYERELILNRKYQAAYREECQLAEKVRCPK